MDVRKVLQTGMMLIINTLIAYKDAGIRMIGTGMTNPPSIRKDTACFK
ncbi:hypothetical protein ACFFHH_12895 [Cytobacillus solani]|nr:hypothetical protein [Cytobacillus solani]USK56267.1 hypothetical protein LIS82_07255 [Cytobacillus solani]